MYKTNLKRMIESMEVGESVRPMKGYKEITLRNYASCIGRAMGRKYSVKNNINHFLITRTA